MERCLLSMSWKNLPALTYGWNASLINVIGVLFCRTQWTDSNGNSRDMEKLKPQLDDM